MESKKYNFPEDFLFGTATSAYQIEGHNYNNDWYEFEQNPRNTAHGETAGISTDHWNRYLEDFELMDKLKINSYRMSIEWSKIFPKDGKINQNALEKYQEMVKNLKNRKLNIMLNLHHFTIPLWFMRKGGFKYKENVRFFEEYADVIGKYFSDDVDIWCTMNEPMVIVVNGFYNGEFPPKEKNLVLAIKIARNLMRIHAVAYNILKERSPNSLVGLVKSTPFFQPLTESLGDRLRTRYADYIYTHSVFRSIMTGKLPLSFFFRYKHLKNSSDYIGVNYYSRMLASKKYFSQVYHGAPPNADPEYLCAGLGWQSYPRGLFEILKRFSKMFPNKPLFVSENGIGTDNDEWRQYYLLSHLLEVKRALDEGIDVMGYHYWSLIDNFEWNLGFGPRFGLIHVNYETLKRTIKESGHLYSKICKDKTVYQSDIDKLTQRFPDIEDEMKLRPL
jgi:beta-glucosidase